MCRELNYFKIYFLLFLIVLLNQSCADVVSGTDRCEAMRTQRVVGGPCEYKSYRGIATITSVRETEENQESRGGPSCQDYVVRFSFSSDEKIEESYGNVEGKEYALKLTNSWNPGAKFLKKYGIKSGRNFECYLKVITKGTCTPVLFDFPAIDLGDYFEFNGKGEKGTGESGKKGQLYLISNNTIHADPQPCAKFCIRFKYIVSAKLVAIVTAGR
ncbi:MAG: hypothetical protein JRD43_00640 [Deltaproteobacteria bacterium]|nr:hypothetical protein [Deltaproteobacteria bacterium]MBW2595486.1 hypothetical protein [Deltaproteobacteria bacterium]MBW2649478.1 hypothetical protein [Deltaproteobacteria bacterium]